MSVASLVSLRIRMAIPVATIARCNALDAATGAKRWSFVQRGVIDASAAVVNGVVYVGSTLGNVFALAPG